MISTEFICTSPPLFAGDFPVEVRKKGGFPGGQIGGKVRPPWNNMPKDEEGDAKRNGCDLNTHIRRQVDALLTNTLSVRAAIQ